MNSRRDFIAAAGMALAAIPLMSLGADTKAQKTEAYAVMYGAEKLHSAELYDADHNILGRTTDAFSWRRDIRRYYNDMTGQVTFVASGSYVSINGGKEYVGLGLYCFRDKAEYLQELAAGKIIVKREEPARIVLNPGRCKDIFGRDACSIGQSSVECQLTSL